ncbi:MAG: phosphatase PAP2 family protein [Candidatus Thermoplasmatota archaeon]
MLPLLPLAATGSGSYGLDESVFRALNLAGTNPVLDVLMSLFSAIALPYILPLLAIPLWWKRHRELAFDLLVLLVVVILVTEVLKYAIGRQRPCDVLANVTPNACATVGDPSLPSGHASRIFAVAALLSLRFKWGVRLGSFGVAILTGLSRVYLGVHWPSDVLAGAVLGIALAVALVVFAKKVMFYPKIRTRVIDAVARRLPKRTKA